MLFVFVGIVNIGDLWLQSECSSSPPTGIEEMFTPVDVSALREPDRDLSFVVLTCENVVGR